MIFRKKWIPSSTFANFPKEKLRCDIKRQNDQNKLKKMYRKTPFLYFPMFIKNAFFPKKSITFFYFPF